jgi:hypothetical protein
MRKNICFQTYVQKQEAGHEIGKRPKEITVGNSMEAETTANDDTARYHTFDYFQLHTHDRHTDRF